jgi:hypothetical protein
LRVQKYTYEFVNINRATYESYKHTVCVYYSVVKNHSKVQAIVQ